MKKLMIAAAAAAMICGAEAKVATYNFIANLRTTTGRQGTAQYTLDSACFGKDAAGNWWYNDTTTLAPLVTKAADGYTYSWVTPANYPHLQWIVADSIFGGVKHPSLKLNLTDTDHYTLLAAESALLKAMQAAYPVQSAGFWCFQGQWEVGTPAQCYRWTTGDNLCVEVDLDRGNCCSATYVFSLTGRDPAGNRVSTGIPVIAWEFLNRFCAQTAADCEHLELFASVGNVNTYVAGLPFNGYLAGQGYQEVRDGVNYPINIQGSIVGKTTAPDCMDCCVDAAKAIAFDCLDTTASSTPDTAAYGTFYLQLKAIRD